MAVEVREAAPAEVDTARELVEEYVESLGIDLGFQEIEQELAELRWLRGDEAATPRTQKEVTQAS